MTLRILHLEDSAIDHQMAKRALDKDGNVHTYLRVDSLSEFLAASREWHPDLILADYRLPGFTAIEAWAALQEQAGAQQRSTPPFVLLSGAIGESAAVDAVQRGISDYLLKDSMHKLPYVVARALEIHEARQAKVKADEQLAQSQQQLAKLTQYLQTSIENERAALAREVHDDIGGSLAAIRLNLAWIERHGTDAGCRVHLKAATDMLQHAINASQRILHNLRPAILDQGLVAAVQWLADSFAQRTGVATRVKSSSERIDVPKPVQLVAYRTAQEALTNASKYADAKLVRIELSSVGGVLTLEVADDGGGFDRSQLSKSDAFGLRGLQERADTVGGWLDVSSQPGRGTSVTLTVPLTERATGDWEL